MANTALTAPGPRAPSGGSASGGSAPGPLDPIVEYFTRRRAFAVASRVAEPERKRIAETLSLSRQKADAADALWSNGHAAEALVLAVGSLLAARDAALASADALNVSAEVPRFDAAPKAAAPERTTESAPVEVGSESAADGEKEPETPAEPSVEASGGTAPTSSEHAPTGGEAPLEPAPSTDAVEAPALPPREASETVSTTADTVTASVHSDPAARLRLVLASAYVSRATIDSIEAAFTATTAELPLLDAQVNTAHTELYQQTLAARKEIDRAIAPAGQTRRELGMSVAFRAVVIATLLLVSTVGYVYMTRVPEGRYAEASAVWASSPEFVPERAIDGDPTTRWLLPDGATGWLDVRISPAETVHQVRLLNTVNAPYNDRATHRYRVELFSNGQIVHSIEGAFEYDTTPDWVEHEVPNIPNVDRVRFNVLSHHRTSAGLNEIEIH